MKAEADRADQVGVAKAGRNPADAGTCAEADLATRARAKAGVAVVERGNLRLAYQGVVENKGAAGVDQLAVTELKDHLKRHRPTIRVRLLGEHVSTGGGAPRGSRSRKAGCARSALRRRWIG
jgi:RNA-directed DNA polymerase